jgi:hypothetical protein
MEVRLTTEAAGAAPRQIADLTQMLRDDVLASGALSAEHPTARRRPPDGSKGAGLEYAELVVSIAGNLAALVVLVRDWTRDRHNTRVRIEIGGDVIEVDGATDATSEELLRRFLARHAR